MAFGNNLVWFLNELANSEIEQFETGSIEIYGENKSGQEGSCEVDVLELVRAAIERITTLEEEREDLINCAANGLAYKDILNTIIVSNQSSVIEDFDVEKNNKGMLWIRNGLQGPGALRTALEYAKSTNATAQKWFDTNEPLVKSHQEYVDAIESGLSKRKTPKEQ
jgi:hypothetical protein